MPAPAASRVVFSAGAMETRPAQIDLTSLSPPIFSADPPATGDDVLFLALQRLARALRDLDLIDEQLVLKHEALARLLEPDRDETENDESLNAVVWGPAPWAPPAPPRPLFTTFSLPDREISLEDALAQMRSATRRYARRQLTWFRHQLPESVHRVDALAPLAKQVEAAIQAFEEDGGTVPWKGEGA